MAALNDDFNLVSFSWQALKGDHFCCHGRGAENAALPRRFKAAQAAYCNVPG